VSAGEFSLAALYAALDAQREARGLSWAQAVREINTPFEGSTSRPIAASTITSTRTKLRAEGDGVLQMIRWLNRTPESFIPEFVPTEAPAFRLPPAGTHQVIRLDTRRLYGALNARRTARGMTWEQVSRDIRGTTVSTLTHLARGGRTGFPHVVRMTRWLEQPLASFTRVCPR
jgi:uncharacterized protein YfiM (DUF2279 family)